jgi:hypothetical protein
MAIVFHKDERVILIEAPDSNITIQELVDAIRAYEKTDEGVVLPQIANASGKEDLGGGVLVGITLELLDNWRVQFEARPGPETIACRISGGNLVAINDYNNDPVKPSSYVFVTLTSSSSATISELQIENLQFLIESLRDQKRGYGNIWYWNPIEGSDNSDGRSPTSSKKTFEAIQPLLETNDVVFAFSSSKGASVVTSPLTITASDFSIRGPGESFYIKPDPSVTANFLVNISGSGVEFSGINLQASTAGQFAIMMLISGDNALIENCHFHDVPMRGIGISASINSTIRGCYFDAGNFVPDSRGVCVRGGYNTQFINNRFENFDYGIRVGCLTSDLDFVNSEETVFENNIVIGYRSSGFYIESGGHETLIRSTNYIQSEYTALNRVVDFGVNTSYESNDMDKQSYLSLVRVNTLNGYGGSRYPTGTSSYPASSLDVALSVMNFYSFSKIILDWGEIYSTSAHNLNNVHILANQSGLTDWYIDDSPMDQGAFENIYISGSLHLNDYLYFYFCDVEDLFNAAGYFWNCGIFGTIQLDPIFNQEIIFDTCGNYSANGQFCTIDCNHSEQGIVATKWSGNVEILNHTSSVTSTIDLHVGVVKIDSSCTGGTIIVRGIGEIVDESSGTNIITNLVNDSLTSSVTISGVTANVDSAAVATAVWNASISGNPNGTAGQYVYQQHAYNYGRWFMENNQLKVYAPNGTLLQTFDLFDSSGSPSLTGVVRREPI